MIVVCALLIGLGVPLAIVGVMGFVVLWMIRVEIGHWPGTRPRWKVYVTATGKQIHVGVRRGGHRVMVAQLGSEWPDDFDLRLAEAVSEARTRALSLNGADRCARRKLPR